MKLKQIIWLPILGVFTQCNFPSKNNYQSMNFTMDSLAAVAAAEEVYSETGFLDPFLERIPHEYRLDSFGNDLDPALNGTDTAIWRLIDGLSINELVGQMTQIDLALIAKGDVCALQNPQTLDIDKMAIAFGKYKVGSVLNVGCGSGTIELNRWNSIINNIQLQSAKYDNHGISVIYGIDAIHGVNYTMGGTLFPQQIGQAATWNPDLIKKAAQITAYEVAASGIHWNFSPVLDIGRQPLWSRFFETYGEDVYLAKQCTKAAIQGYQNNPGYPIAACMKHFLGYSNPSSGKDRTPAHISDRELYETYLPTFEEAIKNGAKTLMINSGEINGVPVHTDKHILIDLLRYNLKFKGVAVTDWEDIYKLHTTHKVAPTLKEAVFLAIDAGVDMSMTPSDFKFNNLLIELVDENRISRARLEQSVYRILKLKKELGLIDATNPISPIAFPDFGSASHASFALQSAEESITLLKNNAQTLPAVTGWEANAKQKKYQRILLMGNAVNSLNLINGAWSHTWQGVDSSYNTKGKPTILSAIRNEFVGNNISVQWLNSESTIQKNQPYTSNDLLIYCLGEKPATEIPGNIDDLNIQIPEKDLQILQERKRKNLKTVLVLCLARPRIITAIDTLCTAVVHTYLPGDEGGTALASLLSGRKVFSGKLPFTYPRASGDIVHYDRKTTEDNDINFGRKAYNPLYDFGHGLSYTEFSYDSLTVNTTNDSVYIAVNVKNTGKREGKEVVQVYYRDEYASVTPSVKKLVAFKKISLSSGKSQMVTFAFSKSELSFIDANLSRVFESGDFTFMVKQLSKTINLEWE